MTRFFFYSSFLLLLLGDGCLALFQDNRLISYVEPSESCPPVEQLSYYTHVILSLTPDCHTHAACSKDWMEGLHDAGTTVLLGSNIKCASRDSESLVDIVIDLGLDGIVLEIEEDDDDDDDDDNNDNNNSDASPFDLVTETTLHLRHHSLPTNAVLAHAVVDKDILPGSPYFYDLKHYLLQQQDILDFVIVHYANGVTRPGIDGFSHAGLGHMAASQHYQSIVEGILAPWITPTQLVVGFCLHDCSYSGSNVGAAGAVEILQDLGEQYECHGGAAARWAHRDVNGDWSRSVASVLEPRQGCAGTTDETVIMSTTTTTATTTSSSSANEDPEENLDDCSQNFDCSVSFYSGLENMKGHTVKRMDENGVCEEACAVSLSWHTKRGYVCGHCDG